LPEQLALRPAVFLDRDGTIAEEMGYLNHVTRFRMFPFVSAAIRRLNEADLPVIVVTNQSGVGRGYFPESLVHTVNELMTQQLAKGSAKLDAIYYARTHLLKTVPAESQIQACWTSRPGSAGSICNAPLWLATVMATWNSRETPVLAVFSSAPATVKANLPGTRQKWPVQPDFVAEDLAKAADWILRQHK